LISSFEVQSMISQQQQGMAAQLDYSYQTSMGYMGNIGAYGMNQMPMMPQGGGEGFSYRAREGYGLSNQVGMGTMGMVNTTAGLANVGMNLAGMYGGFRAARMAGSGMGRSALAGGLAFTPGMVGGMALSHIAGNMMEGAREDQGIYGTLGQNFGHINSGSRTGRGFSRQDAKSIADFTRELQALPEMMTSMGELNKIMNTISQMGMMHGARSAQEFNKRFKENLNTIKEISKVMQTTMEEATQYMAQARQAGFHSQAGALLNTAQRSFTSGITGMNQQQIQQLQMTGSQMSFGTGGYRRSGANMALRTARQVGMANEMGVLTNDHLRELTGLEGSDAIGAMSEMLTGAAYRMSNSGMGTAMSIAVAEQDKSGRFTGGVDQGMVDRIRSGGINKGELLSLVHKKVQSKNAKISWGRQKDRLRSEMASAVGVEGITMELEGLLGSRGWDNPDVTNIVMQRFGVDERTASAVQAIGKNIGSIQGEIGSRAQVEGRRQAESGAMANLSMEAIKKRFLKKMENTFEEPFKKLGSDMSDGVSRYVDEFMDGLLERHSVEITKSTADLVSGALTGNAKSQKALSSMSLSKSTNDPMQASYSLGQSVLDMVGTKTQGREKYEFLSSLPSQFKTSSGLFGGTLSQSSSQEAAFRGAVSKAGQGIFRKDVLNAFSGLGAGGDALTRGFKSFMGEHNAALNEMSQVDRLNYIRTNFLDGDQSGLARRLTDSGASPEEVIALLQRKSGSSNYVGSFNASSYLSERYGKAAFRDAGSLSKNLNKSIEELSGKFHNKGEVRAVLSKDSSERTLFLAATSGDADAQKLLRENLPTEERERLLKKFGVSEGQVDSLRSVYGAGGGEGASSLANTVSGNISQAAMGGIASQLRRLGGDMADRMGKLSGIDSSGFSNSKLGSFIKNLQSIDSPDKLVSLLGEGGSMSGDIRGVLDQVRGLKGAERDKALDILGPGARAALSGENNVRKAIRQKNGLSRLREGADDEIKGYIDQIQSDKKITKEEENELVKKISDKRFANSLSTKGTVSGQEVEKQKELTAELTKFVEANSKFAQIVIDATPSLKGAQEAAEKVRTSGANITNRKS